MVKSSTPQVLLSDEEVKAGQVRQSFENKMAAARSAAINSGSYVMPSLTADEAAILIHSSSLLAYLRPKAKKSAAKK
ncbi:hypothetical protein [Comamonas testosteroni]|uniref:hypothetical protein n=1 Tax=Comamonas testosteroni TaxID=285 RepID=UPI0026EFD654|nr:hypothetical protein [Comamonas testosteroni]